MIVTTSWISANYDKFNQLYFGGTLPNITFKTNRSKNSWGFATFCYDWANDTIIPKSITISNYYDSPEEVKIQTLLHEMIHIEDYFWHPEHFIRNHHKVSRRSYNAHGYWFNREAERISKESGYKVADHVTHEEMKASSLSERSKRNTEHKQNTALLCVITGDNGLIFYFKTDIYKAPKLRALILTMRWYRFNEVKSIKFYKFNDPRMAAMRSCGTRLRGWYTDKLCLMNKLKSIHATEVKF